MIDAGSAVLDKGKPRGVVPRGFRRLSSSLLPSSETLPITSQSRRHCLPRNQRKTWNEGFLSPEQTPAQQIVEPHSHSPAFAPSLPLTIMSLSSFRASLSRAKDKLLPSNTNGTAQVVDDPDLLDATVAAAEPEPSAPAVTLAVIGAGQRGKRYASYALINPKLCKVVAVAEPRPRSREIFAQNHKIREELAFTSYGDFLKASQKSVDETGRRLADAVNQFVECAHIPFLTIHSACAGYCRGPRQTTCRGSLEVREARL